MTPSPILHIADSSVDDALDMELRALLSTCFTKPQDEVFKYRRYFKEMPAHRWIMRSEDGPLVAHLAVHERTLLAGGRTYPVGGVAEVCVHPDHRGRGYLKMLFAQTHSWLREREYAFAVLFGDPRYYASSGYIAAGNLHVDVPDADGEPRPQRTYGALVALLGREDWPQNDVAYIPGPSF